MRHARCICEPSFICAGERGTWKFSYAPSTNLPAGTKIKFDPLSRGRPIDWELPNADSKEKKNAIWAVLPNAKSIYPKIIELPETFTTYFEFTLPSQIKAGDHLTIFMGIPGKHAEQHTGKGNRAQTIVQRRKPFHLYIDPKGKGDYREPEIFTLDIRGNILHDIRIIAPSLVSKNKRFDVIVRFEDAFGNLTNNAPEGTLIELSYEHLRENLNWKLFVPETGFINLPNLYFNEPGIYKIQLANLQNGAKFYSSPILCVPEAEKSIYWGLLHGETERADSLENIESCLRYVRDEQALQFYATSSFESSEETSNDAWKLISHQVAEFNEEMRFSTILGFQWYDEDKSAGVRQILYTKDNKPLLRKKENKMNVLSKIYKSHSPKELLSIPSFTMADKFGSDFSDFQPEFEHVVEIYNAWGSSECSKKEGNPRPITSEGKKGLFENEAGSIRRALNKNCRFGFVAGGLDDRSIYSGFYESDQVQYSPGLTAILSIELTREALVQALTNRSCYATTGERIILIFSIAEAQMGSELSTKTKPGLAFNRHITGYIAGTSPLKSISFVRNGEVFKTLSSKESYFQFAFDDDTLISTISLKSPDSRPPFVYYYIRVEQENGEIAWSSPIWIDCVDLLKNGTEVKKTSEVKKKKKS